MFKLDLILQIMNQTGHCLKKKLKSNWMNERRIRWKNFVRLRAETYSSLMDGGSEDKKAKGTKKYAVKRKLRFENYKNCLEATQPKNKINRLEKIELTSTVFFVTKERIKNS